MAIAEADATTVRDRVDLLNAIILPSVLFTAKFARLSQQSNPTCKYAEAVLWRRQLRDDPSRHKISPSLIFTSREAGGLGLVAIPVAFKAQRVKAAMKGPIETNGAYQDAWRYWTGFSGTEPVITPRQTRQSTCPAHWSS